MNKIGLSALVLVATAGSALGQGQMNFRIVAVNSTAGAGSQAVNSTINPFNDVSVIPNTFGATGPFINTRAGTSSLPNRGQLNTAVNNQATANPTGSIILPAGGKLVFVLQASYTSTTPGAVGIASAGGDIATNEQAARGNFQRLFENGATNADIDPNDNAAASTPTVYGHFKTFNFLAVNGGLQTTANGDLNTTGGNWNVNGILGVQTNGALTTAAGAFENIYAFTYMDMGGPDRDVTLTFTDLNRVSAPFKAVPLPSGLPDVVDSSLFTTPSVSYTFHVNGVPAPGTAALLGLGGLVATRRRRTA